MRHIFRLHHKASNNRLHASVMFLLVISLLYANSVQAEEMLELDATAIIGSLETPKVIHNLPWKRINPVEGKQVFTSLVEQELSIIRRDSFRRQVKIYHYLKDKK